MLRFFAEILACAPARAVIPALVAAFALSSCTSTGSVLDAGTAGFAGPATPAQNALATTEEGQDIAALLPQNGITPAQKPSVIAAAIFAETDVEPAKDLGQGSAVAILASDRPPAAETSSQAQVYSTAAVAPERDAQATGGVAVAQAQLGQSETGAAVADAAPPAAAAAEVMQAEQPKPAVKKPKSLFAAMFGTANASKPVAVSAPAAEEIQLALAEPQLGDTGSQAALAGLDKPLKIRSDAEAPPVDNGALPGVRQNALFEIKHRSSASDDSSIDISEEDSAPVQVAYAAGLARLTPNGLKVQRESVDVACLKPQLVTVLKGIERHYGRSVVITSGYRSPTFNRRVRGAKHSLHMYCAAADIQIDGVSKWSLAQYLRALPGRGGVGTYCSTESVHVDIGPNRDWNWRCSRRKRG